MSQDNYQIYRIPGRQHLTVIIVKKPGIGWADARKCIRQIGPRRVIRLIPTTRCAFRKWLEVGPRTLVIAMRHPVDPKLVIQALDMIQKDATSVAPDAFMCQPAVNVLPDLMPVRA